MTAGPTNCLGRYPKYNVTAKKLFRRLEALGAHMLLPVSAARATAVCSQWLSFGHLRAHLPRLLADRLCGLPASPALPLPAPGGLG